MRNYLQMLVWSFAIGATVTINAAEKSSGPSDTLISALIHVESSGNVRAIGDKERDHKAYGPLQVRQPVCDDINRRYHTAYKAEDCLGNLALSVTLFKKYVTMWGTEERLGRLPTDADYARIWNGGPNGWKSGATVVYINKVKRALETPGRRTLLARQ